MDIGDVLNRRGDLSTFVVHLSRDAGGTGNAKENLKQIIRERTLRADQPMGFAVQEAIAAGAGDSQRVVCFSETPLEFIYALFGIAYRSVDLKPYGLAFTKMGARRRGVNPIWYFDMTWGRHWAIFHALAALRNDAVAQNDFSEHPAATLFPFFEPMYSHPNGDRKEFWWEREWRHCGDLRFELDEVALWLAPEEDHSEIEQELRAGYSDARCIDPRWSLERVIAHLVGLHANDVTPFV